MPFEISFYWIHFTQYLELLIVYSFHIWFKHMNKKFWKLITKTINLDILPLLMSSHGMSLDFKLKSFRMEFILFKNKFF